MKSPLKSTNFILAMCITLVMLGCAPSPERSAGTYVDDAWISSKVKSALLASPEVSGLDIQVETFAGVVQLSGFVNSQSQAQRAVDIAEGIKGVQEVKNNLIVNSE